MLPVNLHWFLMHVVLTVCPKNWVRFGDSCYKFSSKSASWNAAKAFCEAQGSHLLVINSRAENQAIGTHSSHHLLIGLHRDPNHQSRWLWVDGSRPNFTNWLSGEPNNAGGSEACVELASQRHGWKWNDISCTASLRFVCETSGESIRSWPRNILQLDANKPKSNHPQHSRSKASMWWTVGVQTSLTLKLLKGNVYCKPSKKKQSNICCQTISLSLKS